MIEKRLDIMVLVPEDSVDAIGSEIKELIERKYGGKVKGINVSSPPPVGAGTTSRDVA